MKKLKCILQENVLLVVFMLFLLLSAITSWLGFDTLLDFLKLLWLPVLIAIYFGRKYYMSNVFFIVFFLMFLGGIFDVFAINHLMNYLSEAFYIGAFLLLVFVLFGRMKPIRFEGVETIYLMVLFLINVYLFYVLYNLLKINFTEGLETFLFVFKGITLTLMAFIAFVVYLSHEDKQSILFLTMVYCFVFLEVVNMVYIAHDFFGVFEWLSSLLYFSAIMILFKYVDNHHEKQNDSSNMIANEKKSVSNSYRDSFI